MDHVPVDGTEAFWANGAESRDACKRAACDSTDGGSVGWLPISRIRRKTSANEREEVGWVVVAGGLLHLTYFSPLPSDSIERVFWPAFTEQAKQLDIRHIPRELG